MKICPILSMANPSDRACQYKDCMFWNEQSAACSIAVIAQELSAGNENTAMIADSVADVSKHTTPTK